MSSKVAALFGDYAAHHRTQGNQWCHAVGIPLIAAGLLGLLAQEVFQVRGWSVELAPLLVLLLAPVYLWMDLRLGAVLTGIYFTLYLGVRLLSWQVSLGLFVAGWVFQFVGHGVYEKRSPAFFRNLVHLWVGPLWVLNHLLPLTSDLMGRYQEQEDR